MRGIPDRMRVRLLEDNPDDPQYGKKGWVGRTLEYSKEYDSYRIDFDNGETWWNPQHIVMLEDAPDVINNETSWIAADYLPPMSRVEAMKVFLEQSYDGDHCLLCDKKRDGHAVDCPTRVFETWIKLVDSLRKDWWERQEKKTMADENTVN